MKHVFDCTCNVRDLGGLKSADHREVIANKLFRSDVFCGMSSTDIEKFQALDIKDVVDFRSVRERKETIADHLDGVNYHNLAAFKEKKDSHEFDMYSLIEGDEITEQETKRLKEFMQEGYRVLPFDNKAYQKVFDLMLENEHGILFHCSAGKDRTGVMAALILTLLGVDKEQIYRDFLQSNQCRKDKNETFLAKTQVKPELVGDVLYAISVHTECLDASFEEILKKYTSMEEYFEKEYGLDEHKIAFLKSKYLR